MKHLFLLGFLALASAYPLESSKHDLEERDLDHALSHKKIAPKEISFEDAKKQLKERLDDVLLKIKEAIDQGKVVKLDFSNKVKEIREKLKVLKGDLGDKGKELLQKILGKGWEFLKKLFENLGSDKRNDGSERALNAEKHSGIVSKDKFKLDGISKIVKVGLEQGKHLMDVLDHIREKLKFLNIDLGDKGNKFVNKVKDKVKEYWDKLLKKLILKRLADIDVFGMLEKLAAVIKNNFNAEKMKSLVEKCYGKGSEIAERFIAFLKENGEQKKQKLLKFIDLVFADKEKSVKEFYKKIRDFALKDLSNELKEKVSKFEKFLMEAYLKGYEKGKTRGDNVRNVAKEFFKETSMISDDLAKEALNFFRDNKDDLRAIFENVKTKVGELLKKEA